ncbi:MAG: AI-2E family transporter [Sedimentisphaerales bacterium]|nr:AI-2E family transporter [Sedimentisphaerales bacterium]
MIDLNKEQDWLIRSSIIIIAIVAIGVTLIFARSILIPFVLAVFIYLLVSPLLDLQIHRLKIPRIIAITTTLLVVLVILTLIYILASEAIQTILATAGQYSNDFTNLMEKMLLKIEEWGISFDRQEIINNVQSAIPKFAKDTFGKIISFFSSVTLVSIFVIFLLIGRNSKAVKKGIYSDIEKQTRRYIFIKTVSSLITGTLVWIILAAFDLKLAAVFGMLAFMLNFIPSIGSIIATVLPVPVAVAQFQSFWPILLVILIPGAVQMTMGNIIEPKIMGKELQLHPVIILLALSFWGLLWGVIGMFLAVPMTAIIRIILMRFELLKPLGKLLAGQLPEIESKSSD